MVGTGSQVKLARDFAHYSDAACGPLEPGCVGIVVETSDDRAKVAFEACTWWYDHEALTMDGLLIGARVCRGPDWKWDEQDGGAGGLGTVQPGSKDVGWFEVTWDHDRSTNLYRYDVDGECDLEFVA